MYILSHFGLLATIQPNWTGWALNMIISLHNGIQIITGHAIYFTISNYVLFAICCLHTFFFRVALLESLFWFFFIRITTKYTYIRVQRIFFFISVGSFNMKSSYINWCSNFALWNSYFLIIVFYCISFRVRVCFSICEMRRSFVVADVGLIGIEW